MLLLTLIFSFYYPFAIWTNWKLEKNQINGIPLNRKLLYIFDVLTCFGVLLGDSWCFPNPIKTNNNNNILRTLCAVVYTTAMSHICMTLLYSNSEYMNSESTAYNYKSILYMYVHTEGLLITNFRFEIMIAVWDKNIMLRKTEYKYK